jgi:hypothetical protein
MISRILISSRLHLPAVAAVPGHEFCPREPPESWSWRHWGRWRRGWRRWSFCRIDTGRGRRRRRRGLILHLKHQLRQRHYSKGVRIPLLLLYLVVGQSNKQFSLMANVKPGAHERILHFITALITFPDICRLMRTHLSL